MEYNIIETDRGVRLEYTKNGMGCMLFATGTMTIVSLIAFTVAAAYYGLSIKAFIGAIIGVVGTLFFGPGLVQLILSLIRGRGLLWIEDGVLISHKQKVPLKDIADLTFGRHDKTWSGRRLEDLIVETVQRKTILFRCNSLVSDEKMDTFVEKYILPHAAPECRRRWEHKRSDLGNGEKLI
ncbi:YfjD family protein [Paenibacillus sp. TRM 82003]|nr:YfjD family protein [Paenibacillus sp. TRM 82003]